MPRSLRTPLPHQFSRSVHGTRAASPASPEAAERRASREAGGVAGAGSPGAPAGARLLFTQSTGPIAPLYAAATDCTAPVRSLARALTAAPCAGRAFRIRVDLVMPQDRFRVGLGLRAHRRALRRAGLQALNQPGHASEGGCTPTGPVPGAPRMAAGGAHSALLLSPHSVSRPAAPAGQWLPPVQAPRS